MALGPINNLPLVPVPTGGRQVPAQPNGADSRVQRTRDPEAAGRFAQELSGADQQGRQRPNAIPLEEISADLPRGSILDITV